jgi:hypothetical protein
MCCNKIIAPLCVASVQPSRRIKTGESRVMFDATLTLINFSA